MGEARRHDAPREDGKPDKPAAAIDEQLQPPVASDPSPPTPEPHPVLAEVLSEYSAPVASPIPPWQPDLLEPLTPTVAPREDAAPLSTGHVVTVYPDAAGTAGPRSDPAPDQRG